MRNKVWFYGSARAERVPQLRSRDRGHRVTRTEQQPRCAATERRPQSAAAARCRRMLPGFGAAEWGPQFSARASAPQNGACGLGSKVRRQSPATHSSAGESPGPPQPPVNRVPTKGAIIAALVSFAAAMYFAGHGSTVTPQGANMLARATADTRLTPHQRRTSPRTAGSIPLSLAQGTAMHCPATRSRGSKRAVTLALTQHLNFIA